MEKRTAAISILCTMVIVLIIVIPAGSRSAEKGVLAVLDPRGELFKPPIIPISPRLKSLDGKKIAILNNTKPGADAIQPFLEKALKEISPTVEFQKFVIPYNAYPGKEKDLKKVAEASDAVIGLLGD